MGGKRREKKIFCACEFGYQPTKKQNTTWQRTNIIFWIMQGKKLEQTFPLSLVRVCKELLYLIWGNCKLYSCRDLQRVYAEDVSILETQNGQHNGQTASKWTNNPALENVKAATEQLFKKHNPNYTSVESSFHFNQESRNRMTCNLGREHFEIDGSITEMQQDEKCDSLMLHNNRVVLALVWFFRQRVIWT